jgi:hypothetical protein
MKLKGFAKNYEDLFIKGWVCQEGDPSPLEVKVYWQGRQIAKILADSFRPDLLEKQIHPTGHCSFNLFYSDIEGDLPLNCELELKVGPDEMDFPSGPLKIAFPKPYYDPKSQERFYFLHIPKTAGTSFQRMLYHVFPQKEIFPNMADLHRNQRQYPTFQQVKDLPQEKLKDVRLLMGHWPAATAQKMPEGTHILTFLREPMARTFSDINHKHPITPHLQDLDVNDAIHKMRNALFNVQTRHLADHQLTHTPYHNNFRKIDAKGLQQAKEQLEACAFFGIKERFDESIVLAERKFAWKFPQRKRLNLAKNSLSDQLSAESISFLKDNMTYDFELYEFALELFEKRVKKISYHIT